jgi:hypothetical protein
MIRRALILFFLLPNLVRAEDVKYRTTTLAAVIDEWNAKTKSEGPGISFSRPEKIRFVTAMRAAPVVCSTAPLETVLKMMNFADLLKQVRITHCVTLELAKGGSVVAYVQDSLVPGLNTDAKIGRPIDIYADFLAYAVDADRSRSAPMMLVNRFEPR